MGRPGPRAPEAPGHDLVPAGEAAGYERRYELECESCGLISAAETEDEADVVARLHEAVGARRIKTVEVGE
ncbi:MAG: hypothetical protein M3N53_06330 [Actinomycetota bacterium]|nr:hypothetical protein [Actinomycetota bacterium]